MYSFIEERRVRRSGDKDLALNFQLEHVRERGRLEALVLTDLTGSIVANAGDPLVCRELGFLAPIMAASDVLSGAKNTSSPRCNPSRS